jgi:hypothetical protein
MTVKVLIPANLRGTAETPTSYLLAVGVWNR